MSRSNGAILNKTQISQLVDYSGMTFTGQNGSSTISPTDLDGMIEYHGKCFILFEFKYGDAGLTSGQRIAFERLIDSITKPALLIVANHDTPAASGEPIDAANATVRAAYGKWRANQKPKWHEPTTTAYNARWLADWFVSMIEQRTPKQAP